MPPKRKGKGRKRASSNKKRKPEDQQDSIPDEDAPEKTSAVLPVEEKNVPAEPVAPPELPVKPSTTQAVDVDVRQRRGSSLLEEQILELLGDVPPSGSTTLLRAGNENVRPMPPKFQRKLRKLGHEGWLSEATRQYYLNLGHGDSPRVPNEGGRKSLLEHVLRQDAQEGEENLGGSGWKPGKELGQGAFGTVILWEKTRRNGPPLRIATKDATRGDKFFADYNNEGNLVRRLNDAGCKNVIKVLDWYLINKRFRTCFEFAEFGNLLTLEQWYRQRGLVLPEAFVWHVFYSIANALCFCAHGTNRDPSRTDEPRWDRIVHGDLKGDNILLAAPDQDCHRLYPCLKLADFGQGYTLGPNSEAQRFKGQWEGGRNMYHAPEVGEKAPTGRLPRAGELEDTLSDVYSLGVILSTMCIHSNEHLAEPIKDLLQGDESANPSGRRIFSSYYSVKLKELIRRCRSQRAVERPSNYDLYLETKSWTEAFRGHAYWEEQEARGYVVAGIAVYHQKVLWTKDEQTLFDTNSEFREAYQEVNYCPIEEAEDLDVVGSVAERRQYDRLLQTVDESIITAIPSWPDSGPFPFSDSLYPATSDSSLGSDSTILSDALSDWQPEGGAKVIAEPPTRAAAPQQQEEAKKETTIPRKRARGRRFVIPDSSSSEAPSSPSRRTKRIHDAMNLENVLNVKEEKEG